MQSYQADVIIVGGGIAGIVAAYELIEGGKKVLLLDRDKATSFGGLAKWAFGGMFFVDSKLQRKRGIQDNIELAKRDWFAFAEFEENEYWGKEWANQYIHLCTPHGYDWMKKRGFSFFPVVNWVERGLEVQGNSVPRFHMVWGTGWELTQRMIKLLRNHPKAHNLSLKFGHRVADFVVENERVKGVIGNLEKEQTPFEAQGDLVIVATGGINGSIEKVKQYWDQKHFGEAPKTILNGAHPMAIGDLHEATQRVSGNVVNLEKQWNYAAGIAHPNPRYPGHGLSLVPSKSALWLNYRGERFGPTPLITAYDTRFLVERICQEPVKYSWQLMNRKIALKEFAISGSESNPLMRDKKFLQFIWQTLVSGNKKLVKKVMEECEDVLVAYSLEELVEKMNALAEHPVELKLVKEAVARYDQQIALGPDKTTDRQLQLITKAREYRGDKVRTCNFQPILDSKAMPLIAVREFILSRKSLGGIQTNLQGRVMSQPDPMRNQHPIPGLFAIGEAAGFGGGGMHGKRSLEGTFLGGCLISARVTAKAILGDPLH